SGMDIALKPDSAVARDTLQQRVAVRLRELLIQGALPPGAKLNERVLCEQLGVSRTPLREAIRALAAEGLLSMDPGRGAYALALSTEDVAHTFDVIAVLEGLAAERAAAYASDDELAEMRALQFEMQAAFERRDLAAYYRHNARIHELLSDMARNPVLKAIWQQLNARLQALRFLSNQDEAKWARALQEHAAILQALQARDATALRQLLVEHLRRKRDAVLERLQAVGS